jgi:hypothetical protein
MAKANTEVLLEKENHSLGLAEKRIAELTVQVEVCLLTYYSGGYLWYALPESHPSCDTLARRAERS